MFILKPAFAVLVLNTLSSIPMVLRASGLSVVVGKYLVTEIRGRWSLGIPLYSLLSAGDWELYGILAPRSALTNIS